MTPELEQRAAAETELYATTLEKEAQTAFSRCGLIAQEFSLHGSIFRLRCAGEVVAQKLSRALQHLAIAPTGGPSLTIDCWDATSAGLTLELPQWPEHLFTNRGEILGLDGAELRIAYFNWLRLLNAYFPARGRAYYCLGNATPFPQQQAGSPAIAIFNWWCGSLGRQLVHAAAVGTEQGAVLIAGHGGAGKSTLAFSTFGTELRYLSDDYCVLEPGNPTSVVALYQSGKLTETSLRLLPNLPPSMAASARTDTEKILFFAQESFPGRLLPTAPMRAIVLSDLSSQETSLTPIALREIMPTLGESTLRQLAGGGRAEFLRIMKLCQGIPTFRLRHGADTAATHRLLLELCAS